MFLRRRRVDGACARTSERARGGDPDRDPQLTAIASLSSALARARDQEAVARTLLEACLSLLDVDFGAVALISEDGSRAPVSRRWRPARTRPGGTRFARLRTGAFRDRERSLRRRARRRLRRRRLAEGQPPTRREGRSEERRLRPARLGRKRAGRAHPRYYEAPKVFEGNELSLLQALAAESALALDRTRSADALAEALERERLIASIARKVRSELDLDAVLRVAVEETGVAVGVDRFFLRLGDKAGSMPIAAEWHADGFVPIDAVANRLPASNLAARERRTVAVGDIREDPALDDPELGGIQTLLDLDALAALATPILVFDQMIGVARPPPLRAGRLDRWRRPRRRGRRPGAGRRHARGTAYEGEHGAARAADGPAQGGTGRDERAAPRDGAPTPRGRGDQARSTRMRPTATSTTPTGRCCGARPYTSSTRSSSSSSSPTGARSRIASESRFRTLPTRASRARSPRR